MNQQHYFSHKWTGRDILFMHQPLQEFMYAANAFEVWGIKEQAIDCQAVNSGLFAAALSNGKTAWISAGGDPWNDFITIYHDIHLSTARQTGVGPAGFSKGGRVFKISGQMLNKVQLHSYSINDAGTHNPDYKIRHPPSLSLGFQL